MNVVYVKKISGYGTKITIKALPALLDLLLPILVFKKKIGDNILIITKIKQLYITFRNNDAAETILGRRKK